MKSDIAVSFDVFYPRLRSGHLVPHGKKIIYETFEPFNQIILPVEMADLIALSGGRFNMREIIEKIYQRQGYVHFRSIFETVHRLQQEGFFENGNELAPPDPSSMPQLQSLLLQKVTFDFQLLGRVSNDFKHPLLFYIFGMMTIVTALFSLLIISPNINPISLSFEEGSYVKGLTFALLGLSALISFKNLLKAIFLILLTGKAYNLSLSVKPWAIHFQVGNESQFLIQSKVFLILYHLALLLSSFAAVSLCSLFFSQASLDRLALVSVLYLVWQLNPFIHSQLTQFFRNLFDLDGKLQVSSYFSSKSILHLLDPYVENIAKQAQVLFRWIHIGWTSLGLIVFSWVLIAHLKFQHHLSIEAGVEEFVIGSLVLLALFLNWNYMLYQTGKTLFYIFLAKPIQSLSKFFRKLKTIHLSPPDEEEVFRKISALPVFNNLSDEFIHKIIESSELINVSKGQFIATEGSKSDHLFVLLAGAVEISRMTETGRKRMSEIFPTSIFGETAISTDQARNADVIAVMKSTILRIPAQALRALAINTQYIRDLESFNGAIVVNQFFHSAPMFRELPCEVIDTLINRGKIDYFSPEEVVFEQGSRGDKFYMILRGSVDVVINNVNLKRIRQGGFFGEIAVIAAIPRTATIVTAEPTILLSIQIDSFWEILVQHIELALFIESVGEQRFKEGLRMFHNETKSGTAA